MSGSHGPRGPSGNPGTYHGWGSGLHTPIQWSSGALLAAVLFLAGCGGDARSQDGTGGDRVMAVVPGGDSPRLEASGEVDTREGLVPESPPVVASQPAPAPAEPAPAPDPATRPPAAPPRREPAEVSEAGPPAGASVAPQRTDVEPPPLERPIVADDLPPAPPAIPAGTELVTRLTASLETGVNQAGDLFTARVDEDLLTANGMVMVPMGSEIRGRVVEARESSGPDDAAVILLQVDALVVDGVEIPVRASVVAAEVETSVRDSNTRTAAKVATGAAAGAVLGRIMGRNGRSTTAGAMAGAAAGTAVALATRDGQAVMGPGSRIVIRFDEAVPNLR